jgi:hypothetical protein
MASLDKSVGEIDLRTLRHSRINYACEIQRIRNRRAINRVKQYIQNYLDGFYFNEAKMSELPFKRD